MNILPRPSQALSKSRTKFFIRDFALAAKFFAFPSNNQEIKEQFGEYTNGLELGTMRRRADELDIIFYGTYDRNSDEKRYGDFGRKKTCPNVTTPGY